MIRVNFTMRGDIIIIGEHHRKAAQEVFHLIQQTLVTKKEKQVITIAGESGAGKSEIAAALAELIETTGIKTLILQQDDYFFLPPMTNAENRLLDLDENVGTQEVNLGLLNQNIGSFLKHDPLIVKPLVLFKEDIISEEIVHISEYQVLIIEGTYTTLLQNVDHRVFIDRDVNDTREARMLRNRERQDETLEKILGIEHQIISKHKLMADIVISRDFFATINDTKPNP